MSDSSNLNSFRDRGQVAVQLVSCGVLPPGLVQEVLFSELICFSVLYIYIQAQKFEHRKEIEN